MTREVDQYADEAAQRTAEAAHHSPESVKEIAKTEIRKALHKHPRDLAAEHKLTFGERSAGAVARQSGSWPFILGYIAVTVVYLSVNRWIARFDATLQYYTFAVSVLAIFLAQIILLFQNRQADLESDIAHNAYAQIEDIDTMERQQMEILDRQNDMMRDLHRFMRANDLNPETTDET